MNLATVESVLLALLVTDAIALTVLVLLQQGKGADVGAAFGSGSASTMFGSLGAASFFTKATAWLAIGFFLITFGLAYIAKEKAAAAGSLGIPTVTETVDTLSTDLENLEDEAQTSFDTDIPVSDVPVSDVPAVEAEMQEALEQAVEIIDEAAQDAPNN